MLLFVCRAHPEPVFAFLQGPRSHVAFVVEVSLQCTGILKGGLVPG